MKIHEFVAGMTWQDPVSGFDPSLPAELARLHLPIPAFSRYVTRLCRNSLWGAPDYPATAGLIALLASYRSTDNAVTLQDNRYPILMIDYQDGRALAAALSKADPGQERHIVIASSQPHHDFSIALSLFQSEHPNSKISVHHDLSAIPQQSGKPYSTIIVTSLSGDSETITVHLDILAQLLVANGSLMLAGDTNCLSSVLKDIKSRWADLRNSARFDYDDQTIFICQPAVRTPELLMPTADLSAPAWKLEFANALPKVSEAKDLLDGQCWAIEPAQPLTYKVQTAWSLGKEPFAEPHMVKGDTYPKWLARYDNCRVIGHNIILGQQGTILADLINSINPEKLATWPPGNPGYVVQNHLMPVSEGWYQPDLSNKTVRHIKEPVLVADRLLGTDYTHFLSEVVSRLVLFNRPDWPDMKLLFTNRLKPHHRDILEVVGVTHDQIIEFDPDTEILECRQAYAAGWLSVCNAWIHPDVIDWYASLPEQIGLTPDLPQNRRIYLSRGQEKSWTRKLLNEDELLPVIEQAGFEIINPESLDFRAKIALFYQAEAVIGSYTGGMMHCLFCRPGTKIVSIPTTDFPSLGCSIMASMLDLNERTVFGATIRARTDPANSHFVVDIDALQAAMADLGL